MTFVAMPDQYGANALFEELDAAPLVTKRYLWRGEKRHEKEKYSV